MTVRKPLYSKEEFARRGDEIYESQGYLVDNIKSSKPI
jgi:hypothetical protein